MKKTVLFAFLIVSITRLGLCVEIDKDPGVLAEMKRRDAQEEQENAAISLAATVQRQKIKELNDSGFKLQSKDEVKQAIFSVWRDFRKTLSAGDVDTAMSYISSERRAKSAKDLGTDPQYQRQVAAFLQDIENCDIDSNGLEAECEMLSHNEHGELVSRYIEFVRDSDGTWRIWD